MYKAKDKNDTKEIVNMGRKQKNKYKETNNNLILRNPDDLDTDIVAMSAHFWKRHLAVKSETRKWSLLQQTLFLIVLRQLEDWRTGDNNNTVVLNNHNVMQELGWEFSEKNFKKVGSVLRTQFTDMVMNSTISLQDFSTKKWATSNLITDAEGDSRYTKVTINPKFMNHFEDLFFLATNFGQSFLPILEPDVASFKSHYSYLFFTNLRMRCKVNDEPVEDTVQYSVEDIRKIFDLEDKDYMRNRDEEKKKYSGFDYTAFEKKVLNVAIEEINCSEQIKILQWEDGKFYKKIKIKRSVDSYIFKFRVLDQETIRKQRIQLFEAAKRAGLNFEFYPNFKESFVVDPQWAGQWHVDGKNIKALKESKENEATKTRNDKTAKDARTMFNSNLANNISTMLEREISENQLHKTANKST